MSPSSILLQNGTIVEHGSDDTLSWRVASVLITGNRIARIISASSTAAKGLPANTTVIDCGDKILTPGFVDTHNHVWQTQLKGRHGDDLLGAYMARGNTRNVHYGADDVLLGQVAGALESVDAGTTTVLDFAHVVSDPAHIASAAAGLALSGIRGVVALPPGDRRRNAAMVAPSAYKSHSTSSSAGGDGRNDDGDDHNSFAPSWFAPTWTRLATSPDSALARAQGRVKLGLILDRTSESPGAPQELAKLARELDPPPAVLTMHHVLELDTFGPAKAGGLVEKPGPPVVVAHATGMSDGALSEIVASGARISSTPSSELQMHGCPPVCYDGKWARASSIGVDCHSHTAASLANEVRVGLQYWRGYKSWEVKGIGGQLSGLPGGVSVGDAFNLITVRGAEALGLQDSVGRIKEGFFADIVVWDATTPAMIAGAQHDPVSTIILNSSVRDVDMVIVDGVVRKKNGKILPIQMEGGTTKDWKALAKEVLESRRRIQTEINELKAPGYE